MTWPLALGPQSSWNKDVAAVVQEFLDCGWEPHDVRGGVRLTSPCGRCQRVVHRTPSDHRSASNNLATLRRCRQEHRNEKGTP